MKEDFYTKKKKNKNMLSTERWMIWCLSWQQKVEVIEGAACFDWAQQAGVSHVSA